jgi:glycosyltransferase involved in cell wall biosynthesis
MSKTDAKLSVSAIIPAHNAERYLADAIGSALRQTYRDIEIIVVDDGSTDGTATIAERYGSRVRLVRQSHCGVSTARNVGAENAHGSLLAFLDADDRWLPERVERQVHALKDRPFLEAVVCATRVVDASLRPITELRQSPDVTVRDLLLFRLTVVSVSSNILMQRHAFEEIGGFDPRLSTSADWLMMYRLLDRGRFTSLPEPLTEYRLHDSNMSSNLARFEQDVFTAFHEIFSRDPSDPMLAPLKRRAYANLHRVLAGAHFVDGNVGPFLRHARTALLTHPSVFPYFIEMPVRRVRRWAGRHRPDSADGSGNAHPIRYPAQR